MIGTPEYMAPEQSNNVNDHRSDIYSLGIILYQMLTGHVPFTGDTPVAVTLKHLQTPPTPPRQLNSNIPQSIEDIILKALAKQPDQRYQQANDFSSAYRAALQQEWIITSQAQSLPIQSHNNAQISDKILYTAIISPISTQPLYPCEIPDKYRLFPLDYDEAPIPAIEDFNKKNKRKKFLSIILFSLIISIIIPLGLFWQARNPYKDPSQPNMPTKPMHWQSKAAEQAKINSQATLAAQARVQATVGITSAIGAGKLLYYDDMVQSGGDWINDGKQCYFSPQGYHVYPFTLCCCLVLYRSPTLFQCSD